MLFQNIRVSEAIFKFLELEEVDVVFGIPGGNVSPLMHAVLQHPSILFVMTRHEGGAAFMADGYARSTGKLGVCLVTAGPGAMNAITGIAGAHADNSSVLLITGQPATHRYGMLGLQESTTESRLNVTEMIRECTSYSTSLVHANSFQNLFSRALKIARGNPFRTVHVSIPMNIANANLSKVTIPDKQFSEIYSSHPIDSEKTIQAFEMLKKAKSPLIYLGSGCRQALTKLGWEKLNAFINKYGIPLVTSPKAKGIFPESNDLSFNVYGVGGSKEIRTYLENNPLDAVLIVGSRLSEWSSSSWNRLLIPENHNIIQVDLFTESMGNWFPVKLGIISDAHAFLKMLCELGENDVIKNHKEIETRIENIKKTKIKIVPYAHKMDTNELLKVDQLMIDLNEFIDGNTDIYVDAGNCLGWTVHYLQINPPARFFIPLGLVAMGWSVGAVVGGKMGCPHRTAIAITGDASFLMNGNELSTAAQYNLGTIYLVLNDNCELMVEQGMRRLYPDLTREELYFSLGNPDIKKFTESLGGICYEISKPGELTKIMPEVLKNANKLKKPQVICAKVDRSDVPPYGDRIATIRASLE